MKQNITTESAIITDSIREKTEETIKRYYDQQDANNENKRICQDSSEEEKPIDYGLRLLSDINTKKPPLSPLQIAINNLQVCLWTTYLEALAVLHTGSYQLS